MLIFFNFLISMYSNNNICKKGLLTLVLFLFSTIFVKAQENKSDFWEHVRFGGGLGLNITSGLFSATVAPSGIYQFNDKLAIGLGLNATFNNQRGVSKSTILGGSVIGLYNIFRELQLSAEFEQLNVNRKFDVTLNRPKNNYWIPALYFGAGYRQGNFTIGVRYDVLHDENRSVFIDAWAPFVRFYF